MHLYTKILIINWIIFAVITIVDMLLGDLMNKNTVINLIYLSWDKLSLLAIPVWAVWAL